MAALPYRSGPLIPLRFAPGQVRAIIAVMAMNHSFTVFHRSAVLRTGVIRTGRWTKLPARASSQRGTGIVRLPQWADQTRCPGPGAARELA